MMVTAYFCLYAVPLCSWRCLLPTVTKSMPEKGRFAIVEKYVDCTTTVRRSAPGGIASVEHQVSSSRPIYRGEFLEIRLFSAAQALICLRECKPSLNMMLLTWVSTDSSARFPGKQGNLAMTAFRLINELAEGRKFSCATNQDWTNQRLIKRYSHDFPRLLTKTWTFTLGVSCSPPLNQTSYFTSCCLFLVYSLSLYYNISNCRSPSQGGGKLTPLLTTKPLTLCAKIVRALR